MLTWSGWLATVRGGTGLGKEAWQRQPLREAHFLPKLEFSQLSNGMMALSPKLAGKTEHARG